MAERKTAARPYAEAVFRLAQARKELPAWSERLALMAAVASDARIARLVADPRVSRPAGAALFADVCAAAAGQKALAEPAANLVRLLAENQRLGLLPEIAALYEELKAEAEGRVEATVVSAFALEPAQLKQLEQALKRRLARDVRVTASVDASLLGGVVIRAGDVVIDGSVRERLTQLASELIH